MIGSVPVSVAASVMNKSPLFVRESIAQGKIDGAFCIEGENGRRSFYISPVKFYELTGFMYEGRSDEEG